MAKRSYIRSKNPEADQDRLNPEWWGVGIAAAAMVIAIASVVVAFLQYLSMQDSIAVSREISERQLKFAKSEIDKSSEDTKIALELTRKLVNSSHEIAKSGEYQNINTERMANSSIRYTDIAANSLRESTSIARRQQRAYIDVEINSAPEWWDDKGIAIIGVSINNSGLTPAYNTKTKVKVAAYPSRDQRPSLDDIDWDDVPSPSRVSGSNGNRFIFLKGLSQDDVKKIGENRYGAVVLLKFSYDDIFGSGHEADYCWSVNSTVYEYCDSESAKP